MVAVAHVWRWSVGGVMVAMTVVKLEVEMVAVMAVAKEVAMSGRRHGFADGGGGDSDGREDDGDGNGGGGGDDSDDSGGDVDSRGGSGGGDSGRGSGDGGRDWTKALSCSNQITHKHRSD